MDILHHIILNLKEKLDKRSLLKIPVKFVLRHYAYAKYGICYKSILFL